MVHYPVMYNSRWVVTITAFLLLQALTVKYGGDITLLWLWCSYLSLEVEKQLLAQSACTSLPTFLPCNFEKLIAESDGQTESYNCSKCSYFFHVFFFVLFGLEILYVLSMIFRLAVPQFGPKKQRVLSKIQNWRWEAEDEI